MHLIRHAPLNHTFVHIDCVKQITYTGEQEVTVKLDTGTAVVVTDKQAVDWWQNYADLIMGESVSPLQDIADSLRDLSTNGIETFEG